MRLLGRGRADRERHAQRVLVACGSDFLSPARLPRVLHEAGCHVTVLCPADTALTGTRFADEIVLGPGEIGAFVETLRAHLAGRPDGYRWILVADDPLLSALCARARTERWLDSWFPIDPRSPALGVVASKAGLVDLAPGSGLPLAPSRVCHDVGQARAAVAELGLPVVVKRDASFAGLGVRRLDSVEDLPGVFRALAQPGERVVVQAFVRGPTGNTIFLMDHGLPLRWISAYKVRTFPGPFGPSSARAFTWHADAAPMVEALGRLTGYHGLGACDWIEDGAGRLRVIEVNTRPVPIVHLAPLGGVDFAAAIADMLAGTARPAPPPHVTATRILPMFPEDAFRALVERDLGALVDRGLLRDVPWTDPGLLRHIGRYGARMAHLVRKS